MEEVCGGGAARLVAHYAVTPAYRVPAVAVLESILRAAHALAVSGSAPRIECAAQCMAELVDAGANARAAPGLTLSDVRAADEAHRILIADDVPAIVVLTPLAALLQHGRTELRVDAAARLQRLCAHTPLRATAAEAGVLDVVTRVLLETSDARLRSAVLDLLLVLAAHAPEASVVARERVSAALVAALQIAEDDMLVRRWGFRLLPAVTDGSLRRRRCCVASSRRRARARAPRT
jgi:hypothetical protein